MLTVTLQEAVRGVLGRLLRAVDYGEITVSAPWGSGPIGESEFPTGEGCHLLTLTVRAGGAEFRRAVVLETSQHGYRTFGVGWDTDPRRLLTAIVRLDLEGMVYTFEKEGCSVAIGSLNLHVAGGR